MDWLNYHHLLYFWVVAKEGSIARASKELRLAHPTISGQIHRLEDVLGEKLFEHRGRTLVLTDAGRMAFGYAQEIFSLGQEFVDAIHGRIPGRPIRLVVGLSDVLPKSIVHRMLQPAFALDKRVQLVCREARSTEAFLGELALQAVDVVLSDAPAPVGGTVKLFNHLLGECGTVFFASPERVKSLRAGFPGSLQGADFILPGHNAALRQALEQWFELHHLRPNIVAEVEDSSLVKELAEAGLGVVALPDVVTRDVRARYKMKVLGMEPELRQQFYAISVERKVKHPAVIAICDVARQRIFA